MSKIISSVIALPCLFVQPAREMALLQWSFYLAKHMHCTPPSSPSHRQPRYSTFVWLEFLVHHFELCSSAPKACRQPRIT